MKRLFFPAFVAILLLTTTALAQSTSVTGDWQVTITSPNGTREVKASFKQEGEKLTGVFKGERGELPLQGTIKGKEVKFTYTVKFQDQDLAITMTGNVDGNTMTGKADFGGFAEGDWSAKRATEAAAASQAPASSAPSAEKIDVSGTWAFEVETPAGSGSPSFTFKQEGETLTGQYKGAFGEAPLTGTIKGNEIKFSIKINAQGQEATLTYSGTVEKNSMKGKVELGDFGSGTFTAKRQ
jgi:hypothetical protein